MVKSTCPGRSPTFLVAPCTTHLGSARRQIVRRPNFLALRLCFRKAALTAGHGWQRPVQPSPGDPKMRVHSRSRRFRDLSVAAKVTIAVGVAVVVTLVTGVLGLRALSTAADRTADLHQQNVLGSQLAQEIRFQFLSSRFNSTSSTYSSDPAAKQNYLTARDEARAALNDAADRLLTETEPTAQVRAAVKTSMGDIAQYIELG